MNQVPVICLIHGHGVDASIWDGIYADLASEGQIIKHDYSWLTNATAIDEYADEVRAQLEMAGVEKAILVGHSMGGYIALAVADHYPDLIQGLVLYHSTAKADDDEKRKARWKAIEELEKRGTVPFIQKQLPKMVAPGYPAEKIKLLIDQFVHLPAYALMAGMEAMASRPDRTHVLREATFPVLIVLGGNDQLIPYEKTAQLADLSSRVNVVTINNAGHLSMVEQPESSVELLRSFRNAC